MFKVDLVLFRKYIFDVPSIKMFETIGWVAHAYAVAQKGGGRTFPAHTAVAHQLYAVAA